MWSGSTLQLAARRADRLARLVHVGLRQQDRDATVTGAPGRVGPTRPSVEQAAVLGLWLAEVPARRQARLATSKPTLWGCRRTRPRGCRGRRSASRRGPRRPGSDIRRRCLELLGVGVGRRRRRRPRPPARPRRLPRSRARSRSSSSAAAMRAERADRGDHRSRVADDRDARGRHELAERDVSPIVQRRDVVLDDVRDRVRQRLDRDLADRVARGRRRP